MKLIVSTLIFLIAGIVTPSYAMMVTKNQNPIMQKHVTLLREQGISIINYFNNLMIEMRTHALESLQKEFNITPSELMALNQIKKLLHAKNPLHKKSNTLIQDLDEGEDIILAKQILAAHDIQSGCIEFILKDDPTDHNAAQVTLELTHAKTGEKIYFTKESLQTIAKNPSLINIHYQFTINTAVTAQLNPLAKKMLLEHEIGHLVHGDLIELAILQGFFIARGISSKQIKHSSAFKLLRHYHEYHADLYAIQHNMDNASLFAQSVATIFNNNYHDTDSCTHPSPQKRCALAHRFLEYLLLSQLP